MMQARSLCLVIGLGVALAGCTKPTSPNNAYALASALTAAERAALAYTTLPPCAPASPLICSEPSAKQRIKDADNDAYAAVKRAENGDSAAMIAAQAAISRLIAVTPIAKGS